MMGKQLTHYYISDKTGKQQAASNKQQAAKANIKKHVVPANPVSVSPGYI